MGLPERITLTALLVLVVAAAFFSLLWWLEGEPDDGTPYADFMVGVMMVGMVAIAVTFVFAVLTGGLAIWS